MEWTLKSITTNNGSEFYDWKKFKRSINNYNNDINVYFYHSYCVWEKGGIEHFNFTFVSQKNINNKIDKINGIYCESLNFKSAFKVYNDLCQINFGL